MQRGVSGPEITKTSTCPRSTGHPASPWTLDRQSPLPCVPSPSCESLRTLDLRAHVAFETLAASAEYDEQLARRQGWLQDQLWPNLEVRAPWRLVLRPGADSGSAADFGAGPPPPFYVVIFAFHHSLMDGSSKKAFHEHLLTALNDPSSASSSPSPPHLLSFPRPPMLPEAQDDVVATTVNLPFLIGALWNEHAPRFLRSAAPWHGKAVDFSIPYRTCTLAVDVALDMVAALIAACRAHDTSLTGLFHALVLACFALRLGPDASAFAAATPISLRPYLDPEALDPRLHPLLRSLTTAHSHHFPASAVAALRRPGACLDALVWSNARRVRSELFDRLATLPVDDPSGLLHYVGDWFAFWRAKDGRPRADSWEVSNIGVLSCGGDSGWFVERVFFTNGAMVAGPPLGVGVATAGPAGTLTIGLSWQDTVLPDGLAEQLTRRFHETGNFSF